MIINLRQHDITATDSVHQTDIPLAYISTTELTKKPYIKLDNDFVWDSSCWLRPYEAVDSEDPYLFDSDKNIIKNVSLKEKDGAYYYEPANQTEFVPLNFSVYVEIQKRMEWSTNNTYNLKVSVIESSDELEFSGNLIRVFGDKYLRGFAPPNIRINGGAINPQSLISVDYRDADFVFIKSSDGIHIGDTDEEINIDEILDCHTNIWLSTDDFQGRLKARKTRGWEVQISDSDASVWLIDKSSDTSLSCTSLSSSGTTVVYSYAANDSSTGVPNIVARINGKIVTESLIPHDVKITQIIPVQEIDSTPNYQSATGLNNVLVMSDTILFKQTQYPISMDKIPVFVKEPFFESEEGITWQVEYPNDATMILHKQDKGFVIVTPRWFLEDLEETHMMVYEIMMGIYFRSYLKSKEMSLWITDDYVNYYSYNLNRMEIKHPPVILSDLLKEYDNLNRAFDVRAVITSTNAVTATVVNLDQRNFEDAHIDFKKKSNSGIQDPPKELGQDSYYTTKHTVVHYQQEDIMFLEERLIVDISVQDNIVCVIVNPYHSSKNRVNTTRNQIFTIEDFSVEYALYVNQTTLDFENQFFLIPRTETPEDSWLRCARIGVKTSETAKPNDTRIMGGGLPSDQPDDYDLMDIGNLYGRPYRLGSQLVIRLPRMKDTSRVYDFDERLKSELDKHIALGDYYTIVYEDREEENS